MESACTCYIYRTQYNLIFNLQANDVDSSSENNQIMISMKVANTESSYTTICRTLLLETQSFARMWWYYQAVTPVTLESIIHFLDYSIHIFLWSSEVKRVVTT